MLRKFRWTAFATLGMLATVQFAHAQRGGRGGGGGEQRQDQSSRSYGPPSFSQARRAESPRPIVQHSAQPNHGGRPVQVSRIERSTGPNFGVVRADIPKLPPTRNGNGMPERGSLRPLPSQGANGAALNRVRSLQPIVTKPLPVHRPLPIATRPAGIKPLPVNGTKPAMTAFKLLPASTNGALIGIIQDGKTDQAGTSALNAGLAGRLLNGQQVGQLTNLLSSPALTTREKAAIAQMLQNDRDEKRKVTASTIVAGVNGLLPVQGGQLASNGIIVLPNGSTSSQLVISPDGGSNEASSNQTCVELGQDGSTGRNDSSSVENSGSSSDLGAENAPTFSRGMKISSVEDGPAANAGLIPGDIIVQVGDTATTSLEEVVQQFRSTAGKVSATIFRSKDRQWYSVELEPQNGKIGVSLAASEIPQEVAASGDA